MSQTNVNVPGNGESTGAGMVVGLILAVIVIGFLVWWFLLNGGNSNGTPLDSATDNLPSLLESILPGGS